MSVNFTEEPWTFWCCHACARQMAYIPGMKDGEAGEQRANTATRPRRLGTVIHGQLGDGSIRAPQTCIVFLPRKM
jgi:hypothetical protein